MVSIETVREIPDEKVDERSSTQDRSVGVEI